MALPRGLGATSRSGTGAAQAHRVAGLSRFLFVLLCVSVIARNGQASSPGQMTDIGRWWRCSPRSDPRPHFHSVGTEVRVLAVASSPPCSQTGFQPSKPPARKPYGRCSLVRRDLLNILARKRDPGPAVTILTPHALRVRHTPIADCARYDQLRNA